MGWEGGCARKNKLTDGVIDYIDTPVVVSVIVVYFEQSFDIWTSYHVFFKKHSCLEDKQKLMMKPIMAKTCLFSLLEDQIVA